MSEQSSTDPPLPCPPRPDHLPAELLIRISLLLDHPSALAFALTSRAFTLPAREQIQRHLDLSLHPHFGELPREATRPPSPDVCDTCGRDPGYREHAVYGPEKIKEARDRDELYAVGMRAKVDLVLAKAQMGRAESVRLVARRWTGRDIVRALAAVAPTVLSLIFGSPPEHLDDFISWDPWAIDGLEIQLVDAALSFPFLTHIRLDKRSIGHAEFILWLLDAAPLLEDLDVEIDQYISEVRAEGSQFPPYRSSYPRLKRARFAVEAVSRETGDTVDPVTGKSRNNARRALIRALRERYEATEDFGDLSGFYMLEPVIRCLAKHFTSIQQYSVECHVLSAFPEYFLRDILEDIERHPSLEDLRCSAVAVKIVDRHGNTIHRPFPSVRRLALIPDSRDMLFKTWPIKANPELLWLDCSAHEAISYGAQHWMPAAIATTDTGLPDPILAVRPELASLLRQTPRLRGIHFGPECSTPRGLDIFTHLDKLDRSGLSTFRIRSFSHDGAELLRIRIHSNWEEISDVRHSEEADAYCQSNGYEAVRYIATGGTERVKLYEHRDEPTVRYLTDFEGLVVPLEVIRKMKRVERVTKAMSEGRGVEVGKEAWQVLLDWRDSVLAAEHGPTQADAVDVSG